jgi:hypothetical protein
LQGQASRASAKTEQQKRKGNQKGASGLRPSPKGETGLKPLSKKDPILGPLSIPKSGNSLKSGDSSSKQPKKGATRKAVLPPPETKDRKRVKKVSFEGDVPERESARICYLEEDAEVELTFEVRFHQSWAMNFFLSHISTDSPFK